MNLRPPVPQTGALTRLRYAPNGPLLPWRGGEVNAGIRRQRRTGPDRTQKIPVCRQIPHGRSPYSTRQRDRRVMPGRDGNIVNRKRLFVTGLMLRGRRVGRGGTSPDAKPRQRTADPGSIGFGQRLKTGPGLECPRVLFVGERRSLSDAEACCDHRRTASIAQSQKARRLQIDADGGHTPHANQSGGGAMSDVEITWKSGHRRLAMNPRLKNGASADLAEDTGQEQAQCTTRRPARGIVDRSGSSGGFRRPLVVRQQRTLCFKSAKRRG